MHCFLLWDQTNGDKIPPANSLYKKKLYSDRRYYYITLQAGGKRMTQQTNAPTPSLTRTSFDEHLFHEMDSINFLSSGKEWYGEEFTDAPGHTLTQVFQNPMPDAVPNTPFSIKSNVVARSFGSNSQFTVTLNGTAVQQLTIPATTAGPYSPFAMETQQQSNAVNTQSDA